MNAWNQTAQLRQTNGVMFSRKRITWLAVAVLAAVTPLQAQTPLGSGLTYQGQLQMGGSPVNETADFQFTLWDADVDGTMIGSVVAINNVSIVDGLFTVELDFGSSVFNGDARWLEIDVASPSGGEFTTLSPRQPLTAAPYALKVPGVDGHSLDSADGSSTDVVFVDNAGNVGIGTTDPGDALEVVGTVAATAFVGDGSGLTGISGDDLGSHTATQNIAANGHWFSNDGDDEGVFINGVGNVGIGTDTPNAKLNVVNDTAGASLLAQASGEGDAILVVQNGSGRGLSIFATSSLEAMRVVNDGSGLAASFVGNVNFTNGNVMATGDVRVFGTVEAAAFVGDGSGLTGISGDDLGSHTATQNIAANGHWLSNDGDDEGVFIDGAGNVGFGTNSPESLFQVRSKPVDSGSFNAETTAGALLKSSSDNGGNTPTAPEAALILAREGIAGEAFANYARFDLSRYEVVGFAPRTQLDIRLTHAELFGEGNNTPTILTLQSGGNVGIGITTPAAQLDVVGSTLDEFGRGIAVKATSIVGGGRSLGVWGESTEVDGMGIFGQSILGSQGIGVWGLSWAGLAGQFSGDVNVTGTLSKSAGSFKIDHPLDPENKYLSHSFVESPDMMNIYNGNVVSDAEGYATVQLPEWFEALNSDFRYQLTVIDDTDSADFVLAKVVQRISSNQFTIRTSAPNTEVSWQVTGVRHDAYAEANRIPVEEDKPEELRGLYRHPELYGRSSEYSVNRDKLRAVELQQGRKSGPAEPDRNVPPQPDEAFEQDADRTGS